MKYNLEEKPGARGGRAKGKPSKSDEDLIDVCCQECGAVVRTLPRKKLTGNFKAWCGDCWRKREGQGDGR
jgi:hypothetical protein